MHVWSFSTFFNEVTQEKCFILLKQSYFKHKIKWGERSLIVQEQLVY